MSSKNNDATLEETHREAEEKKDYEAPTIVSETTFETTVLGCTGQDLGCFVPQS